MADSSILATLLGNDELSGFRDEVARDNIFAQLAPAIGGVQFNRQGWSPGEQFGTSLAQAFLSTALGRIGQNQISGQVEKAAALLPDLYSRPDQVVMPEGINESAFNMLKGRAMLKARAAQALENERAKEMARTLATELFGAKLEGVKEKARIEGKNDGYGVDPLLNPESPQAKRNKELFDIESAYTEKLLTGKQAEQALNINRAARNILEAMKRDNPVAAGTAIFEFAKLQDPAGVVRESDEMRVSDPGGPLGKLARIYNEIQQKGKLTPDGKQYIREIVPTLVQSQFDSYNQVRDALKKQAGLYGANPENIQFVQPFDPSPYLQQEQSLPGGVPTIPAGYKMQVNKRTGETRVVPR